MRASQQQEAFHELKVADTSKNKAADHNLERTVNARGIWPTIISSTLLRSSKTDQF